MRSFRIFAAIIGLFCMGAASAWGAEPRDEAVNLVRSAVAFYQANGLEKTLDEIPVTGGKFNKGEMYVFAYDMNAVMLAHPNAKLVGQNMLDLPDTAGKKYRKEIVTKAAADGKGWTEYKYQNPKTKEIEDKVTYFEKVDDLIICCGIYKK